MHGSQRSRSKKKSGGGRGRGGGGGEIGTSGREDQHDTDDEDIVNPRQLTRHCARTYVYTQCPWFKSLGTISMKRDVQFRADDPDVRFADRKSIEQGQVHDFCSVLPDELRKSKVRQLAWFVKDVSSIVLS